MMAIKDTYFFVIFTKPFFSPNVILPCLTHIDTPRHQRLELWQLPPYKISSQPLVPFFFFSVYSFSSQHLFIIFFSVLLFLFYSDLSFFFSCTLFVLHSLFFLFFSWSFFSLDHLLLKTEANFKHHHNNVNIDIFSFMAFIFLVSVVMIYICDFFITSFVLDKICMLLEVNIDLSMLLQVH